MLSGFLSVDKNFSLLIDTLKVELYNLSIRGLETLLILTFSGMIPASASSRSTRFGVGNRKDIPVVRQINSRGFAVVSKLPAIVKKLFSLCHGAYPCTEHHQKHHRSFHTFSFNSLLIVCAKIQKKQILPQYLLKNQ